jgi:hypothetical protein
MTPNTTTTAPTPMPAPTAAGPDDPLGASSGTGISSVSTVTASVATVADCAAGGVDWENAGTATDAASKVARTVFFISACSKKRRATLSLQLGVATAAFALEW